MTFNAETTEETLRSVLIAAVRADKVVGSGTCSVIDEAYTDDELWAVIKGAKTTRGARSLARRLHNINRNAELEVVNA